MQLTHSNYHSQAANMEYMGTSQYKSFLDCESNTMHWLTSGEPDEPTESCVQGNYVHAWNQGTLDQFMVDYAGAIFNKKGEPYAPFKKADEMIATLEADPKIMFYLTGAKEVILTAELFGVQWKVMADVDNTDLNYLLDLKTTRSITEFGWAWNEAEGRNMKVSFIEEWQYLLQMAVYSEVERIARNRHTYKDFYIVAVSKENPPDHAIIDLTDPERRELELSKIREALPRILAVKSGQETPRRCERCDYCRRTKRVGSPVHYTELKEAY